MTDRKRLLRYVLLLIPIMEPKIFTQYTLSTYCFIALNVLEFTLYCVAVIKKRFIPVNWRPIEVLLACEILTLCVGMIFGNLGGLVQWGHLCITLFNVWMLFYVSYSRGELKLLAEAVAFLGTFWLIINLITLAIFPNGIIPSDVWWTTDNDQYFLGIKTAATYYIFPTVAASGYLLCKDFIRPKYFILTAVVSLANIFIRKISTGIAGAVIIALLVFIFMIKGRHLSRRIFFNCAIAGQLGIVLLNIQKYFTFLLTAILKKDATLTSRVYIWKAAKELLREQSFLRTLIGNGLFRQQAFVPYSDGLWQPHNQMLAWVFCSGIVGTVLIIWGLRLLACSSPLKNKSMEFAFIVAITVLFLSTSELYFDMAISFIPFLLVYFEGMAKHE